MPITDGLLHRQARLRYDCRSIGHALAAPPHAGDLWIAAAAVQLGAPLVTADRIVEGVPDLDVA